MAKNYFLLKTEPSTYSFQDLVRDGETNWNGVRNPQARNFLKQAKRGDLALIYHSGDERAVVGIAEISGLPFPDPDPKKPGDWVQFKMKPLRALNRPVTLAELKSTRTLSGLLLIKNSRLSSMIVSREEFELICSLEKNE